MTLRELRDYPDHSVVKVVIEQNATLFNQTNEPHRAVPEQVMFVVWKGYKDQWYVNAQTMETLRTKWDTEYDTMIDAVLKAGIRVPFELLTDSVINCEDAYMIRAYLD